MSTSRLNHHCPDGSRLDAWISSSNDPSQDPFSLSLLSRVSGPCVSAQIDPDKCSTVTRGKGHFFVRYVPPRNTRTPDYGLIVKYYQFRPRTVRPDGFQQSEVLRPDHASMVACYRFARIRPDVTRLSAMVYRVKSAALGRVSPNDLDSLPESAYIDKFSGTHLKNDCRPLLVFTFKIPESRSGASSNTLSRASPKEETDSDIEIMSYTPGLSAKRREKERALEGTKGTRKRTRFDEYEGPPIEKVKRFRPSHQVRSPLYSTRGGSALVFLKTH